MSFTKQDLEAFTQIEVNRLSDADYREYLKSCVENGMLYRFDGGQYGPDSASYRFFGSNKGALHYANGTGWYISPLMVGPEFALRPLQTSAVVFKEMMMTNFGVPEAVIDKLISGDVDFPKSAEDF